MQGSGACKRSLDGKTNSPHYGGYTTHAVESGDPPHGVIVVVVVVVEYYCFLKRIIDVGVVRVADDPSGLFCIIITRGYSVRGVCRGLKTNLLAAHSNNEPLLYIFLKE